MIGWAGSVRVKLRASHTARPLASTRRPRLPRVNRSGAGRAFPLLVRYARLMLSPPFPFGFVQPCLPTASRNVPEGPRWAFEVKHDGYRFIARRDRGRVRAFSRHGKDWSDKVPGIVEAMLALPMTSATLDGE